MIPQGHMSPQPGDFMNCAPLAMLSQMLSPPMASQLQQVGGLDVQPLAPPQFQMPPHLAASLPMKAPPPSPMLPMEAPTATLDLPVKSPPPSAATGALSKAPPTASAFAKMPVPSKSAPTAPWRRQQQQQQQPPVLATS